MGNIFNFCQNFYLINCRSYLLLLIVHFSQQRQYGEAKTEGLSMVKEAKEIKTDKQVSVL